MRAHLLLDTEPRLLVLGLVHGLLAVVAVVGLVWRAVRVVAFGDDLRAVSLCPGNNSRKKRKKAAKSGKTHKDVVAAAHWVLEEGDWAEVDVGIVAWSLVGRAAVKVPLLELLDVGDLGVAGRRLAAKLAVAVDPDVCELSAGLCEDGGRTLGLDFRALVERPIVFKEIGSRLNRSHDFSRFGDVGGLEKSAIIVLKISPGEARR